MQLVAVPISTTSPAKMSPLKEHTILPKQVLIKKKLCPDLNVKVILKNKQQKKLERKRFYPLLRFSTMIYKHAGSNIFMDSVNVSYLSVCALYIKFL